MNGWREWIAGPCPVPVTQRVECVLYNGTLANGLALAFNWQDISRPDHVERWRPAPPQQ